MALKAHPLRVSRLSNPCVEYEKLKLGLESALLESGLYGMRGGASIGQTVQYGESAKSTAASAANFLSAHSLTCQVCQDNRRH
jgi:hypothetical protein